MALLAGMHSIVLSCRQVNHSITVSPHRSPKYAMSDRQNVTKDSRAGILQLVPNGFADIKDLRRSFRGSEHQMHPGSGRTSINSNFCKPPESTPQRFSSPWPMRRAWHTFGPQPARRFEASCRRPSSLATFMQISTVQSNGLGGARVVQQKLKQPR